VMLLTRACANNVLLFETTEVYERVTTCVSAV